MAVTGKTKINLTIAGAVGLLAGLWAFHGFLATHLDAIFVKTARADTQATQIQQAVDAVKTVAYALQAHVVLTELTEARKKLDQLKTDLATTQLWEAANKPNDITRARVRDLTASIDRVNSWIACREAERAACGPAP